MSWRTRIPALLVAGALAAGMSGCNLMPAEEDIMPPPIKEAKTVQLKTIEVTTGTIQDVVDVVGTFVSTEQVELKFDVNNAKLKNVYAKTGDDVEAGTLIAELENNNLEDQIRAAEDNIQKAELQNAKTLRNLQDAVDSAQRKLNELKNPTTLKQNLTDAQNALSKAQAKETENQTKLNALKTSNEKNKQTLITYKSERNSPTMTPSQSAVLGAKIEELEAQIKKDEAEIESRTDAADTLHDSVVSAERRVEDAKSSLTDSSDTIADQQDALARAKDDLSVMKQTIAIDTATANENLENLKSQREKGRIVSPITGKISYINPVKVGDYVDPSQVYVKIANRDKVVLQYNTEIEKARLFKQNMEVQVTVSGSLYTGVVIGSPNDAPSTADDVTKSSVYIRVNDLPETVQMGAAAAIKLVLSEAKDVIVIAKDLLRGQAGAYYVQVEENGIRVERSVEVGIVAATEVQIVKGLEVGEKVIRG